MALASIDDINVHLPLDKMRVDTADYSPLQTDAERIIRGYLAGYFTPTTLGKWDEPDNTPGLIRSIAGRFVASFYYRKRYSEDSLDDPEYAQNKYNEAMELLKGILNGTITLEEVTVDYPTTDRLSTSDFYPNDSTPEPKFTMEMNL